MKKLILIAVASLTVGLSANAQTEKGKFLLGGQVGYDYSKVKDADNSSNSVTIAPQIGFFLKDQLAVGLGLGYVYQENTTLASSFGSSNKIDAFQVAPFVRAYKGDGDFKFFGQLSVPMSWGQAKLGDTKVGTVETYGVTLSPGVSFFPTSKIGVELSVKGLYYENTIMNPETAGNKVTVNNFGLNADSFAPKLGVQFYF